MRKVISTIVIIICVAVIAFASYQIISYYLEASRAEKAFEALRPPAPSTEADDPWLEVLPHLQDLKAQNSDFIGWLNMPNTELDYPVMQSIGDPERYLHKDFNQEYSSAGTLFASEISDVTKPSDVVLIYGHNMKSGAMFAKLKDLLDQEFLDTHNEIVFDTLSNRNIYKIACVFRTEVNIGEGEFKYYNYRDFADDGEFNMFMSLVKSRSVTWTDVQPVYGDKILLLSTCEDAYENGRIVVMAVRTSPPR